MLASRVSSLPELISLFTVRQFAPLLSLLVTDTRLVGRIGRCTSMAERLGCCSQAGPPRTLEHGRAHRERERGDQPRTRTTRRHNRRGAACAQCSPASISVSESLTRQLQDIGAGANCARETIELSSSSSAARRPATPLPAPDDAPPFSTLAPCASSESAKSKPKLRRLSTKRVKMAIFSKLPPSPSRARSAARDALGARSPLEPIFPAVAGGATATRDCPVDLPPPYQLYAANPEREDLGDGAAAPVSPSRFTTITSIEAVRAPDSPVPLFPSPKLSTESVFGSTQSLASMSGILPGPRCPHRSPIARVPELKRKDTMRSSRRSAMTYTRVQPVLWGT